MAFGLQYDGVNDRVNIASPVTIGMNNDGSYTVSFKRTEASNGQALFGLQSGTSSICQILNSSQVFFRINSSSVTMNLTTSLVLDGEYIFKLKRVSNIWSLVDEFNVSLASETVNNNNASTIDQVGAFNGGTIFHGRIDGFVVEESGVELSSLVNTTGTGSVWPDDIGSADGTLVNFPTDDSQWIDLGGGISVTPSSINSASVSNDPTITFNSVVNVSPLSIDSSSVALNPIITFASSLNISPGTIDSASISLDPVILFSSSLNITPQTIDSVSTANNPIINFASLLQVSPQSINSASVSNDPLITFTSALNISPSAIDSLSESKNPLIEFKSVINLTPSTIDSLSASLNPFITIGEVQVIGNVTASFGDSGISVQYEQDQIALSFKPNQITVNFK